MRKIGKLVEQIEEELKDSKRYAEKYIEARADGDAQLSNMYKEMAQDELNHSSNLHTLAVAVIDKIRAVYTPTKEMEEKWNECHQKYIGCSAEIKRMLSM